LGQKKKKKKAKNKPAIEAGRADALIAALAAGDTPELSDAEGAAVAERLGKAAAASDVTTLAHLFAVAPGKQTEKAVKRVMFKLGQRGVEVPELGERPAGIVVAASGGGLPVLMAPPEYDSVRRFTFGVPRDRDILIVEVVFRASTGVYRLASSPSQRAIYTSWAKEMCASGHRVKVDPAMRARKLWEVGRNLRDDRVGPEVDQSLLEWLKPDKNPPPHPAKSLPRRGTVLDFGDLLSEPHREIPLHHRNAILKMRDQWAEEGGSAIIEATREVKAERAREVQKWVNSLAHQWGWVGLIELVLDLAAYCDAIGDHDGATTFLSIGDPPPVEVPDTPDSFDPPDPAVLREKRILELLYEQMHRAVER